MNESVLPNLNDFGILALNLISCFGFFRRCSPRLFQGNSALFLCHKVASLAVPLFLLVCAILLHGRACSGIGFVH